MAMTRAMVDRVADIKGLSPPYQIAQVRLLHVVDDFEHSRSTVEAACEGERKAVPSSAGNVHFATFV